MVFLAQLSSSCSAERVFSKLDWICKFSSDNVNEDMCEICLLLNVNGDLDDMYDPLVVNYNGN